MCEAEGPGPSAVPAEAGVDVLRLLWISWTAGLVLLWLSGSIWWLFSYTSIVGPSCSVLISHQAQ